MFLKTHHRRAVPHIIGIPVLSVSEKTFFSMERANEHNVSMQITYFLPDTHVHRRAIHCTLSIGCNVFPFHEKMFIQ